MITPRDPLAEALLNALKANAYRGAWHSDHSTMMPMAWDADDVVDRIIEDAGLRAALAQRPPETAAQARDWTDRVTAEDVRGYFQLNGWSVSMDDRLGQSLDPFVPIADWIAVGVEHSVAAATATRSAPEPK